MFEKLLFKKVELWLVIFLLILGLVSTIVFGWMVQHTLRGGERAGELGKAALEISKSPSTLMKLVRDFGNAVQPQRIPFTEFSDLQILDPDFKDDGVLLVSSYSEEHAGVTTYLYDLKTRKRLYEWVPPVEDIIAATSDKYYITDRANFKSQHPWLMKDGSILILSGDGPMARVDKCGKMVWAVNRHLHHSIEKGPDGTFFVPNVNGKVPPDNPQSVSEEGYKMLPVRDDGFAEISEDGVILREWSLIKILEDNGYRGLIYGVGKFETDRTHVNDVQPIFEDDDFVKRGDLVISTRHLSTVFLYRPSTNKVIWLQTGPWLNQHDVDYQGNGKYTIFGNDMARREYTKPGDENIFGNEHLMRFDGGSSKIYQYDQATDKATVILDMAKHGIYTESQGLQQLLKNGDFFVEEQNSHILHRINENGHRWKYVNRIDEGHIGAVHWSRYIPREQLDLSWKDDNACR